MCGILGVLDGAGNAPEAQALMAAADAISHRGPDDTGVWTEGGVGFAHKRLAIIDLSPAGHQPMVSGDGRYVIVYNGELYNFHALREAIGASAWPWRSSSDTEVILAAYAVWGEECVQRFKGMFAFAIWDRHERRLFAARDRLGVKPFYYHHSQGRFAFASRPSPIYRLCPEAGAELDLQALRFFLEIGYIPGAHSVHRGLRKLEPGHCLTYDGHTVTVRQYWDGTSIAPEPSWERRSEDDLLEELDELVQASVRSRMVSDVPVGAFLSGGIDSSLVVAAMARMSPGAVKTFSIGFAEAAYDESGHAAKVAQHLGTDHHEERISVNDLLALMPDFRKNYDEPFYDASAFPTMAVARLASRHLKVSLSGDGGDELFGGYHYYRILQQSKRVEQLPTIVRRSVANMLRFVPGHKPKLMAGAMRQSSAVRLFAFARGINKDFGNVLLPDVLRTTCSTGDLFSAQNEHFPHALEPAERGMRIDMRYTLPEDFLQKVDVATMAYSLEARDPLLDHDLAEWSMKLPLSWKLKGGENKYLLRRLLYRYVPRDLVDRPKQGFEVPMCDWLRGPLKSWARERLNDSRLLGQLPLDRAKVSGLLELHLSGRRNVHPLLWAILMLLEFLESHAAAAAQPVR